MSVELQQLKRELAEPRTLHTDVPEDVYLDIEDESFLLEARGEEMPKLVMPSAPVVESSQEQPPLFTSRPTVQEARTSVCVSKIRWRVLSKAPNEGTN